MKKLIGLLLVVCLCLGMMVPVSAAAAPSLSASAASVAPGKTLAVDLDLLNNTGFAYLRVLPTYDADVFTFDTSTVTNAATGMTTAIGPLGVSWDNAEDYVGTDLGTVYFTVAEDAEYGNYTITFTVSECFDETQAVVAVSDYTLTVQVAEPASEILDVAVSLSTDISVKYYVSLHPEHAGATMRFTMNERVTEVSGTATGVANEYVYEFQGVAPQCMGDSITAELLLGDETLASHTGFTVRGYADKLLSLTAAELQMSAEKYAAMQTALADMLEYGAAAQLYRGYKTDALVNSGITGGTVFEELTEASSELNESDHDSAKITSIGLYFDYANSLYVKFTAPDMTDDNFYIEVTNDVTGVSKVYLISDCILLDEETYTYMLVMDPLHLSEYDDGFSISLYAPRSATSTSMKEYQYLSYSAAAYVYTMQNKMTGEELSTMALLARAVYTYAASATAFGAIAE